MMDSGVAVTGALGNLGTKLLCHLASRGFRKLIGLDVRENSDQVALVQQAATDAGHSRPDVRIQTCDLTDPADIRWRSAIEEVGGMVHFAARNPYPEATWGEASASLDMTVNTALAAAESQTCRRYVLATSNHVMGRYRTAGLGPGDLTAELDEGVGTVWDTGGETLDSTPYATAKFAGERVCRGIAGRDNATDYVCVRIGWCQPGENRRETLSAAGTPTQERGTDEIDPDIEATDRWFKGMWLSNRDMVHLFERALIAPSLSWLDRFVRVNGMSNNSGMVWSIDQTRDLLGYEPQDDVFG
jgi:nucleoside-diphosphate-sugar epimerase